MKNYDYIIVGAGIAGCSTAYFLSKYSNSILLIDRNGDVAQGASGAAGAFLSPLLGKPNKFKDLVTKSLNFSINFYLDNIPKEITNCGVLRIPKTKEDEEKFQTYIPFMDFEYEPMGDGYYFKIGSQVNSYNICSNLAKNVEKLFNYEVDSLKQNSDSSWLINNGIKGNNLILTTGADISLIKEDYFNIRAVWGQKIDIYTSTTTTKNYHKECSVSHCKYIKEKNKNLVSIGATHHRVEEDLHFSNSCLNLDERKFFTKKQVEENTKKLLKLANDIVKLEDIELCDIKIGPRASSLDYFPMVGKIIDSKISIEHYPHLKNGSHVKDGMLSSYNNLYVLNGVGGRGFVLSPYLAHSLVENIINNTPLEETITTHRMFKRWVKRLK